MRRGGLLLTVGAIVALPFFAHALVLADGAGPVAVTYTWVLVALTALAFSRAGGAGTLETAVVLGAIAVAWYASATRPFAVFVPGVGMQLVLLWFFGRTLVPGREPLITSIARFVRGSLAPELERYSRRVNWAWCAFFAANAAISVVLAAAAPLAAWSLYANVLVYPLVAVMLAAEYLYRRHRFPAYEHLAPHALLACLVKRGYFRSAASAK